MPSTVLTIREERSLALIDEALGFQALRLPDRHERRHYRRRMLNILRTRPPRRRSASRPEGA
jgi:hypothetical protein